MGGIFNSILALIVSLVLIIGGLTGKLMLRFTNNSAALVVIGAVVLVLDIVLTIRARTKKKAVEEWKPMFAKLATEPVPMEVPCTLRVVRDDQSKSPPLTVMLNGESIGALAGGESLTYETTAEVNSVLIQKEDGKPLCDFWEAPRAPFVFRVAPGAACELHFSLQKGILADTATGCTVVHK